MTRYEAVIGQAFYAPPERAPAQLVSVVTHELPQLRLRNVLAVHHLTQQRQILVCTKRDCSFEITHTVLISPHRTTRPSTAGRAVDQRKTFRARYGPIQRL